MLVLLVPFPHSGQAQEQRFITIGTAGVTGVYFPSGNAICRVVNQGRGQHGVRCAFEATGGSISNLERLRKGEIDFGFVQSDWLHHAFRGSSRFSDAGPFEDLRSVFSQHMETATIVVRDDSGFDNFDDLKGARISVGSSGSGSSATWNELVSRLGWSRDDRKAQSHRETSTLAEALCSGEIDAYFELIGHPANLIEETREQCGIRMIGIDGGAVDALLKVSPYYARTSVPAGTYGLAAPVATFGTVATFVTVADMSEEIVYTLMKSVFDDLDRYRQLHPALVQLSGRDMASRGMAAPLHPGALQFFREQGLLTASNRAQ